MSATSDHRISRRCAIVEEEQESRMLVQNLRTENVNAGLVDRRKQDLIATFHPKDIISTSGYLRMNVCLSGSGPTLEQMEDALKNYEGMLDRKKSFGQLKESCIKMQIHLQTKDEQLRNKDGQLLVKDEQLREQLLARDSLLRVKDWQLQAKDGQIQAKDGQIQAKDEQLREQLQAKDDQLREQLQAKDEQLREQLQAKDEQLWEQLQAKDEQLREQLKAKDEQLRELQALLKFKGFLTKLLIVIPVLLLFHLF